MFCKYCGKPIDETTMRCRICGRPVGTLEGGNGFWDLTGEKPAQPSAGDDTALRELREQVESLREELQQLQARPAAKKHSAGVLAALLALLALAVGVFALFQPSRRTRPASASRRPKCSPTSRCSSACAPPGRWRTWRRSSWTTA